MVSSQPRFLLFSGVEPSARVGGRWHFLLESVDGSLVIEAADEEPDETTERLELLALVRGLEALDQPSRVTLVTASRHVSHGLRYGLEEWRGNHWCWERDGRWVPIKHRDLWQRIDRALKFHHVQCRRWRIDSASDKPKLETTTPVCTPPQRGEEGVGRWAARGVQSLQGLWRTAQRSIRSFQSSTDFAQA